MTDQLINDEHKLVRNPKSGIRISEIRNLDLHIACNLASWHVVQQFYIEHPVRFIYIHYIHIVLKKKNNNVIYILLILLL